MSPAERGGFEPPKRFWRLHAFQACLFNHSSISPSRHHSEIGLKLQKKSEPTIFSATNVSFFFLFPPFLDFFCRKQWKN